jgi:periplasmic divalent cation tolerance protein
MDDEVCEVIITAPDAAWLVEFTRRLVDERLCAAAHHFAPIRTIYRWRGEMHDETEARVSLHTRRSLVDAIVAWVKREHPYEVPGVVVLPVVNGNADYLEWVFDQTRS